MYFNEQCPMKRSKSHPFTKSVVFCVQWCYCSQFVLFVWFYVTFALFLYCPSSTFGWIDIVLMIPSAWWGTSEKINWRPGQLEWGGEGWGCLLLGPWEELLIWLDSSVDPSPPLINISASLSPSPGSISVKTIRVNRNSRFSPTHCRHWVAIAGK